MICLLVLFCTAYLRYCLVENQMTLCFARENQMVNCHSRPRAQAAGPADGWAIIFFLVILKLMCNAEYAPLIDGMKRRHWHEEPPDYSSLLKPEKIKW